MRSLAIAAMWLGCVCVSVSGQQQNEVNAEQDSALTVYKNTLDALRDSADLVRSALDQFRRDLQRAGARTVTSRATRLNEKCASLVGTMSAARAFFRGYNAPNSGARRANRELIDELGALEDALGTHCTDGLAGEGPGVRADSLKAWGPHHASRLGQALSGFYARSVATADALGIELRRKAPGLIP